MLQLRPTCEHGAAPLPPDSTEARICSYECTSCRTCVDTVLGNVCPNGGGCEPRPVRPARDWMDGNTVTAHPPSAVEAPVVLAAHRALVAAAGAVPPERR